MITLYALSRLFFTDSFESDTAKEKIMVILKFLLLDSLTFHAGIILYRCLVL